MDSPTQAEQAAPATPAAVAMESFFTRQRANEGVELPLDLPDGTPTAHRIRIRGIDSDAFRTAKAESSRKLAEMTLAQEKAAFETSAIEAENRRLLASLVISWTFPMDCTPENVANLLAEAPQIAQQINNLAAQRGLFFKKGSTNS